MMVIEFKKFSKIARLSREVVVTEKIDGTNAQIYIEGETILAGSRTRWITPENDNYGFARWVENNRDDLLSLGDGQHFGEWWGSKIQRGYGFKNGDKFFSLFNTSLWSETRPSCCGVVPVLWRGDFVEMDIAAIMASLKKTGSLVAPGYHNPEGVVIYHTAANVYFKKTFDKDDGKFA